MKRLLAVVTVLASLLVVAGAPADAAPRACSTAWGSTAESAGPSTSPDSPILNVRTGRHACFDRLVVDLGGRASGYIVRYVNRFRAQGSGNVIPLPGGARIEIVVRAPGHETYPATVGRALPGVRVAGYDTFRSHRYGGSFEGLTSIGLGVRARLPFRVMKVGSRVVVDVAHRW